MDYASPSTLSLLAAAFYLVVALVGCAAARSSRRDRQVCRFWIAIATAFAAFVVMRMLSLEDVVREYLRAVTAGEGLRDARRTVQAVILVAVGIIGSATFGWLITKLRKAWHDKREKLRWIAGIALAAMVALITVRIVSLHFTDALLFSGLIGPIRLNWIVDLGASATVMVCAVWHMVLRPSAEQPSRRTVSNYRR